MDEAPRSNADSGVIVLSFHLSNMPLDHGSNGKAGVVPLEEGVISTLSCKIFDLLYVLSRNYPHVRITFFSANRRSQLNRILVLGNQITNCRVPNNLKRQNVRSVMPS